MKFGFGLLSAVVSPQAMVKEDELSGSKVRVLKLGVLHGLCTGNQQVFHSLFEVLFRAEIF